MDNLSSIEIKKLFTKYSGVNFLNDFTLQDVEEAKKKTFLQLSREKPYDIDNIRNFLDKGAKQIMEEKFMLGFDKPVGVVVKNTVRDNLNPDYKNTIKRLICIDSQYRLNVYPYNDPDTNECDFTINLTEKLTNVVAFQVENIQIPVTFYNISKRMGNNYFYMSVNENEVLIEVPDGYYSLSELLISINTAIADSTITDSSHNVVFSIDSSKKTIIKNNMGDTLNIIFFDSNDVKESSEAHTKNTHFLNAKGNHNLGWMLGFRGLYINETDILINYVIASNQSKMSEAIPRITTTKYFTLVINDFNQNQTNGTIVQSNIDLNFIKPTTYYNYQTTATNKPLDLDCLKCSNLSDYNNKTLTKAQIFSQIEMNKYKAQMNTQVNLRLECKTYNHVMAIIPFDSSMPFGETYFNDKIHHKREYHGPVDIEKIHVQLFDDKGMLVDLNGNDWYFTLCTEHLYKY
jgi:hypothetical protein